MTARRELIQWLVATSGFAGLDRLGAAELMALGRATHRRTGAHDEASALGAHNSRTVVAAAEIILPRTDTPGATDAGVGDFIGRMLAGWYPPADRDRFLAGLATLDERCRSQWLRSFVDCPAENQAAVLGAIDDEVTALRARPGSLDPNQHWFAMLKYLTIWGYCTSSVGAESLGLTALPMRYDGNAPVAPTGGR